MQSSLVSLPFRVLYLAHAWLFTFDVLLLSRRRARAPVALATICLLLATIIYVLATCGHLPSIDMHLPDFGRLVGNNVYNGDSCPQAAPQEPKIRVSPSPSSDPCVQCPDTNKEWYLSQLSLLSQRIDQMQVELSKCDCGKSLYAGSDLEMAIRNALRVYDADKTGIADYALESAGGFVLSTRCTETYDTNIGWFYLFGIIPLFRQTRSPQLAIQPTLDVGQCWPFKGSVGFLVLQLARRIKVESFTMEHIPASLAPEGNIDSAPNHFQVYGLQNVSDTEGTLLGEYNYNITHGEPLQHFGVKEDADKGNSFDVVELKILTNHGNINYTCLYRFRVHGKPV